MRFTRAPCLAWFFFGCRVFSFFGSPRCIIFENSGPPSVGICYTLQICWNFWRQESDFHLIPRERIRGEMKIQSSMKVHIMQPYSLPKEHFRYAITLNTYFTGSSLSLTNINTRLTWIKFTCWFPLHEQREFWCNAMVFLSWTNDVISYDVINYIHTANLSAVALVSYWLKHRQIAQNQCAGALAWDGVIARAPAACRSFSHSVNRIAFSQWEVHLLSLNQ